MHHWRTSALVEVITEKMRPLSGSHFFICRPKLRIQLPAYFLETILNSFEQTQSTGQVQSQAR